MLNYEFLLFFKSQNSCSIGLALRMDIEKFNPSRGVSEWNQQDLEMNGQNGYLYCYT